MPIVVEHIEDDAIPIAGEIKRRAPPGERQPRDWLAEKRVHLLRSHDPADAAAIGIHDIQPGFIQLVRPHIPVNRKKDLRSVGRETEVRIGAELNHLMPVGAIGVDHVRHSPVPVEHLRSISADIHLAPQSTGRVPTSR